LSTRDDLPEYGPRGYLPPKAAARARKIVLRERMGLGWPVAALAAALVIALAGVVFLRGWTSPPAEPWVAAGRLTAVAPGAVGVVPAPDLAGGVLLVRAAGDVRAFADPGEPVTYCAASGRLEGPRTVWSLDGRRAGGAGPSLSRLPVRVFDGTVYVDPSRSERLSPAPGDVPRGC
jgi:hypothetical protein